MVDKYLETPPSLIILGNLNSEINDFRLKMDAYINNLKSILEEQEQIYKLKQELEDSTMYTTSKSSIFIVHGADSVRYELKDLLKEWGLNPIILDELSSRGRTIIEKFEDHSSESQCAIILLTPDDEGRHKGTDEFKTRARQNVIFELGYFFAKLGRNRVICLYKSDVELPSDISGIIYIKFNDNLKKDASYELRKELKAMGFTIND